MLTRKVQHIESDARAKYIRDLIEAEQIVSFQRGIRGRKATCLAHRRARAGSNVKRQRIVK